MPFIFWSYQKLMDYPRLQLINFSDWLRVKELYK